MKVLVACEYSGVVRDAFRSLGHDAFSCDIIDTETHPEYHIKGDVLPLLDKQWDLIVAHPPCTYLSNAGAKHLWRGHVLNKERYEKGLEAKQFFNAFLNAKCKKICIENPIPSKVYGIEQYSQIIQPYYFGDPFQKKTCLWLRGLAPLVPTKMVEPMANCHDAGTWFMKGGKDRQKNRSRTFPGIAHAMAEQWGGLT
jgi:hypothetical protein